MEDGNSPKRCFLKYVFATLTFPAGDAKPGKAHCQKIQETISSLRGIQADTFIGVWTKRVCLDCREGKRRKAAAGAVMCISNSQRNNSKGKGKGKAAEKGRCASPKHAQGISSFMLLAEFTPQILNIMRGLEKEIEAGGYISDKEFYQGLSSLEDVVRQIKDSGARLDVSYNDHDLKEQFSKYSEILDSVLSVS